MEPEVYSQDMTGTPSKDPKRRIQKDGPDGGFAWCVAFAAFLINFIMAGLSRMSGILYVAFIEMFETDRRGASMPFSVRSSTMNLLGPVVGILGQKYGVRNVSILGGILGAASAAACYFADDVVWITVIWGGVNGVGTALVTTLTTVVIAQYFDKYRTTASGISFSGACIGSFIFPPMMEELLWIYGLQGSFLIIAGIILHTVPAAMILRKPLWIKIANRKAKQDRESQSQSTKGEKCTTHEADKTPKQNASGVDLDYLRINNKLVLDLLTKDLTKMNNKEKSGESCPPREEILRDMEDVYTFIGKTPVSLRLSEMPAKPRFKFECETSPVSRSQSFRTVTGKTRNEKRLNKIHSPSKSPTFAAQPSYKPFILSKLNDLYVKNENQILTSGDQSLYRRVLKELRKLHKVYEAVKRRNIFINQSDIKPMKMMPKALMTKPSIVSKADGFWDGIKNSMKLHTNPLFLLIALCRAVHFITFIPAVTIIVDYAMDKGMHEEDGKYVIAVLSVGDLIGRLCLGWITDNGFVSLPKYMLIGMVVQGICTASLPAVNTKLTFLPVLVLYSVLQGSVFVRHTVLISKYMKSNEQSIAMGCVNFIAGLLGFAVPSYVGFFRDTIGSYDGIFYINGAIGAAAGFLWIFVSSCDKVDESSSTEKSQTNEPKV